MFQLSGFYCNVAGSGFFFSNCAAPSNARFMLAPSSTNQNPLYMVPNMKPYIECIAASQIQ